MSSRADEKSTLQNTAFTRADAQTEPLSKLHYDHLISRFGVMFFEEPAESRRGPLPTGWQVRFAILVCLLATLFMGVASDKILEMLKKQGFARIQINGDIKKIDDLETINLKKFLLRCFIVL